MKALVVWVMALIASAWSACKQARPAPGAAGAGLCATRSKLVWSGKRLKITEPTVRIVAPDAGGDAASLRFVYRGPSAKTTKLASGQLRRQLGLKLRAEDGCNLVYVMWRIEPDPRLQVQVKRNPGAHDHGDCGTGGYQEIEPERAGELPALAAGDAHTLDARIDGERLTVTLDGKEIWRGSLGADARDLKGVTGFRSDNVAADVEIVTTPAPAGRKRPEIPGC